MSRLFSTFEREWPKLVVVALFVLATHSGSAAEPAGEKRYSLSRDSAGSRYSLGTPSSGSAGTRRYSLTNEDAPNRDIRFGSRFQSDLQSPLSSRVRPASAEVAVPDTGAFTQSVFEQVEIESDGVRSAEWTSSAIPNNGAGQEIETVSHTTASGPIAESEPQALSMLATTARELVPVPQSTIALPAAGTIAQTTTLRLDPGQAVFLACAILLFLLSQTAIVWALRKQAIAVSMSRQGDGDDAFGRQMAGFLRPFITARRDTAVFDFNNDPSLITDGPGTTGDQWQAEEEALRQQEQMIIEEVVAVNVALGPELSKG